MLSLTWRLPQHLDRRREILAAVLLVVVGALVLFLRNPDPIFSPVLYTEDANWTTNLLNGKRFYAYFYARPDYLVVGQIAMLDLAVQLSRLTAAGTMAHLPRWVAVISYVFWASFAAFAFLALRLWLPPSWRFVVAVLVLLLPLGSHINEIVGRISNLGYLFLPVSFFLVLLRETTTSQRRDAILVLGLIVCIFTNPICVVVVAVHLGLRLLRRWLRSDRIAWSGDVVLAVSIAVVVAIVLSRAGQGLPYGEDAFIWERAVELFGARSVLYPFVFPFYGHLSDLITALGVCTFVVVVVLATARSQWPDRIFAMALVLVALAAIVVIPVSRPGLTHHLTGYGSTFPDRYYTAQNILVIVLAAWSASRFPRPAQAVAVVVMCLPFVLGAGRLFEYSAPALNLDANGTFADHVFEAVERNPDATDEAAIVVNVFPADWWMIMPAGLARATADASVGWRRSERIERIDLGVIADRSAVEGRPDASTPRVSTSDGWMAVESLHDLEAADDLLRPTGADPFVVFAASDASPIPDHASLLAFNLTCTDGTPPVPMQMFWATTDRPDLQETYSILFRASEGHNVVPLDAHAAWDKGGAPTRVRLDFNQAESCDAYRIDDLSLSSRP